MVALPRHRQLRKRLESAAGFHRGLLGNTRRALLAFRLLSYRRLQRLVLLPPRRLHISINMV